MKMSLAQLRLLQAVVQAGSVGAAARVLGITQSGASQSISALEKGLGLELFSRSRDGVVPTAFTQAVLGDIDTALQAVGRIEQVAATQMQSKPLRLRLAGIPSIFGRSLPLWRKKLQQLYPGVTISSFEGGHIEVGNWVSSGIADIGIASLVPKDLPSRHIRQEELFVVGQAGDPFLRRESVPLEALHEQTVIAAGGCGEVLNRLLGEGAPFRNAPVETQDIATVLEMVRQGIGITVLSEISFPHPEFHGLRKRPFETPAYRDIYLLHRPTNTDLPNELIDDFARIVCADEAA